MSGLATRSLGTISEAPICIHSGPMADGTKPGGKRFFPRGGRPQRVAVVSQPEFGLSRNEILADAIVHGLGIAAALVGVTALLQESFATAGPVGSVSLYAFGLLAMLGCSAAYNLLHNLRCRELLKRLDYAAIFFMVAANYTPFTTEALHGAWSIGLTAAVWAIAIAGIAAKLFLAPHSAQGPTTLGYLAFGWIVGIVAVQPLTAVLSPALVWMIAAGGMLYTVGTLFFSMGGLPYRRAIWHSFVVAGAAVHFCALFLMIRAGA
jgi:hemolysin III